MEAVVGCPVEDALEAQDPVGGGQPAEPPKRRSTGSAQKAADSIFGQDRLSEKSLDEVILSYLAEDLGAGPSDHDEVVPTIKLVALKSLRRQEVEIAKIFETGMHPLDDLSADCPDWRALLTGKAMQGGFGPPKTQRELDAIDEKVRALEVLYSQRISILTGGAGTGKTSVLKVFLQQLRQVEGVTSTLLAAPTGKARVRLQAEEEGLDVSTEIGSGGAQLAPAVLSDDYQFAVGEYLSIMQARENDVGIQVVSNLTNGADAADQGINALLVAPDSGIETVEDLAGTTIAVNGLGGIEEVAVRGILDDQGIDSSGVQFTEVGFPEMNAAVESGDVDVAAQLEPFITFGEQAGLVNLLDPFYESIPGMPLGLFFGSEEWLDENPDLAEGFVRALERSVEAASDVEAMKETIVANTDTDAELVDQIALDHWVADIDRDKLQTVGELATTYGVLEEEPNLDELIWTG